jgi:glyceraldehyde 3-phosphate dehydrogenase
MVIKIGINGFGRIGRLFARHILSNNLLNNNIRIVQINGVSSSENLFYFLKFDSTHGVFKKHIDIESENIVKIHNNFYSKDEKDNFNLQEIYISNERNIEKIKWLDDIDIVIECSGKFNKKSESEKHYINNPHLKHIIVSAPCENSDKTIIFSVNELELNNRKNHDIISVGSCTTNALLPIIKMIHDIFIIQNGFFTTIHSFTNDQLTLDGNHKDLRRGRAASISMIPTKTGANQLISSIFPELKNKILGSAVRVPTPNVSLLDLKLNIKNIVCSHEELKYKIKNYIFDKNIRNIVDFEELPLVSIDFNGSQKSCVIDLLETFMIDKNFIRILAWYDNEYGFVCRMCDVLNLL